MKKPMKILHTVESFPPDHGGMAEVVSRLSRSLSELGHDVTVATQTRGTEITHSKEFGFEVIRFPLSGNSFTGYRWGFSQAYQQLVMNGGFDVVTNFAAQQAFTDFCLPLLPNLKAKKVFIPTGFSALHEPEFYGYFKDLRESSRAYDAIGVLSLDYRDTNFYRSYLPGKLVLLPNGASAKEFPGSQPNSEIRRKFGIPEHHKLILHVGSHTGAKGHEEMLEIFSRSASKNVTLVIAGNVSERGCQDVCNRRARWITKFPGIRTTSGKFAIIKDVVSHPIKIGAGSLRNEKKVVLVDSNRADIVALFKAADLFFFPSNIECSPIVLFEAMAAGVPSLCTEVGNIAELIRWGVVGQLLPSQLHYGRTKVLIPPSIAIFDEMVAELDKWKALAEARSQKFIEHFSWDHIGKCYENLYSDLCVGSFDSNLSNETRYFDPRKAMSI